MLISFVIPVYNGEKTIGPLCRSLVAELGSAYELDIILVNDASRDDSEKSCLELQAAHPESVTYLRLSRNFGEHNAVMAGLNHARGEYVVTMDDDLQNPPAEVPRLLAEIEKGYDIVYARFVSRRDSLARRSASWLHGALARVFLRKPDTLSLSTFRVMNRFLRDEIIKYDGPMPYIDAIILRVTGSIGSVPVRHEARRHGHTNYTFSKLVALWSNAVVSYSLIPLRVIGAVGLISVIFGVVNGGRLILDEVLPTREDPTEYEELTAVIIIFRGLAFMATALVGEYVGRVFLYLNRDPQYIVRMLRPAAARGAEVASCLCAKPK